MTRRKSRSAGRTWAIAGIISAATHRAADVATGGEIGHPVAQPDAADPERIELARRQRAMPRSAREIRAVALELLECPLGRRQPRRKPAGLAADREIELLLNVVLGVVEAREQTLRMRARKRLLELRHGEASVADPEERREVLVSAPARQPDRTMEDERERVAQLRDPRLRIPADDRVGMERGTDAAGAAAGDEDGARAGELAIRAAQGCLRVDPAELLHLDLSVANDTRAEVNIAGA